MKMGISIEKKLVVKADLAFTNGLSKIIFLKNFKLSV